MTEYEKAVKHKLIDLGKTQAWLIEQVKAKENCFIDSAYLCNILNGRRAAPRIRSAINDILDIKE